MSNDTDDKFANWGKKVPNRATKIERVTGSWYKLTMANGEIANITISTDYISKALKGNFEPEYVHLDPTGYYIEIAPAHHIRVNRLVQRGTRDVYDKEGNHDVEPSLGGTLWSFFMQYWDPLNAMSWEQTSFRAVKVYYADMKAITFVLSDEIIERFSQMYAEFIPRLKTRTLLSDPYLVFIGVHDYKGRLQDVITPWHDRLDAEWFGCYSDCISIWGKYVPLTEDNYNKYCSANEDSFGYDEEFYKETQGWYKPKLVMTLEECFQKVSVEERKKREEKKERLRKKREEKRLRMFAHEQRMRESKKKRH